MPFATSIDSLDATTPVSLENGRTATGISGLDEMLNGGFPRGRVILILGEPGAGKTILGVQFLVEGVLEYGERGLLICLEEARQHLYREMMKFGWDLHRLEKESKLSFLDATPLRLLPSRINVGELSIEDFTARSLTQAVQREVERLMPARIVVDSIASLMLQYQDSIERRNALLDMLGILISTGATCLMTNDLRSIGFRRVKMEEFLAHGVIILQSIRVGSSMTRALRIEKMRETSHDTQPRPYKITDRGIEVYPSKSPMLFSEM